MKLEDLASINQWIELEKSVTDRWGLDASIFNTDGIRISGYKEWANRLCPQIKADDKGQAFICAVAHMNLAIMSKNTHEPVIEECDAGLTKIVVPVFVKDEFIGAFGACGLLLDDGEVDSFSINKITGIAEEEVERLAEGIRTVSTQEAEKLIRFVQDRVDEFIADYLKI
jgi:ligand-binding sensor protein